MPSEPKFSNAWLPVILGGLLCAVVGFFYWLLKNQEHSQQHAGLKTETRKIAAYLEKDMESRIPALNRLVRRWEMRGGAAQEEFNDDAQFYVMDMPGFQAIEWVDKTFRVRWIVPMEGNESALNLDLASEPKRRAALNQAMMRRTQTMTPPIELIQGGRGFLVFSPIFVRGEFDGFLSAVFNVQQWLEFVFGRQEDKDALHDLSIMVFIDGASVFQIGAGETSQGAHWDARTNVRIMGHSFAVQCRPTDTWIDNNRTYVPELTGLIGLLFSFLAALMVGMFQRSRTEAWRAYAAQAALENEVHERKRTADQLKEVYDRLAMATRAGGIGVWVWDIKTGGLTWNDIMHELHGVAPYVKPTLSAWRNVVAREDLAGFDLALENATQGSAPFDAEFRVIGPGGSPRIIRSSARTELGDDGVPIRMIGVSWDITEIRKAQEQLASEKSRLSYILEGTNVGTWEWNVQTGETVFNERWANIIGYSLEEISPVSIDTWVKFVHPDDLKTSGDLLEKHFKGELDYYECESRMLHKNGSWVWVLDRGKVSTRSEDGKPLLVAGTHQDITARKNAEERILHLATHDALTDLPRPVVAKDRALMALSLARRNEKSFAVMFVDLDGFKKVNDNYGHDAGDTVLKEVAKRLCSGVRQTDTVARIGGDEFLVILTELQEAGDAGRVAKKLIRIVSQPVAVGSAHLSIGCSIGIATYPTNGGNIDQLIKLADDAMYSVKNAGKNGFAFADGNGKASADEDGAGLGSDPFRG